ncbi:hypothetical protein PROFUN_07935 [Planoprotostelium fungivorum]|uniref:Uncharacterized protein n=1 Tax=Planoprotostelium fungivorum TaxID=1890364 RepID=A0A2P6NL41_9EUKA|nr:hypothetical protein PROFUN_07935 [Planoprotostelium fungivorum]
MSLSKPIFNIPEPLLVKIQAASGLCFGSFLFIHLINTSSAHFGQLAYDGSQAFLRAYYQNPLLEPVVVFGSLTVHSVSSAFRYINRYRSEVLEEDTTDKNRSFYSLLPSSKTLNRWCGSVLSIFVIGHIIGTRGFAVLYDIDTDYQYLASSIVRYPYVLTSYYVAMSMAGVYHLSYSTVQSLRVFNVKVPRVARVNGLPFKIAVGMAGASVLMGCILMVMIGVMQARILIVPVNVPEQSLRLSFVGENKNALIVVLLKNKHSLHFADASNVASHTTASVTDRVSRRHIVTRLLQYTAGAKRKTGLKSQWDNSNSEFRAKSTIVRPTTHSPMKVTHLLFFSFTLSLALAHTLVVPSVHNDCGSTCTIGSETCCGKDSTCYGSITKRCCPNTSAFCGCLSQRAFCLGSVFNAPPTPGDDTFGACYNPSEGTCTYEPAPNYWVVCPLNHQPCKSSSFFSCCAPNQVCVSDTYNSTVPICQDKPLTCPQCGAQSCCNTPRGVSCYAPSTHVCSTDDTGARQVCAIGFQACGEACYDNKYYGCNRGQLYQKL